MITLLPFLLLSPGTDPAQATLLANYTFTQGLAPWTPNAQIKLLGTSNEGARLALQAPDPFLVSPALNFPAGKPVTVTLRMRSSGEPEGQFYFGKEFSEANLQSFEVFPDGKWHEYTVRLPAQAPGAFLRFDPPCGGQPLELTFIRVETGLPIPLEPWATPAQLRGKKMVCGGQFTTSGGDQAVTSRYLAQHPEFTASFPYDGLIIPALIDAKWSKTMGLPEEDRFLHGVVWNSTRIPPAAIDAIATDLKSVKWRGLTDNFLNYSMIDSTRGRFMPDFTNDNDWAILEHNARQAARLCRLTGMKGFWLDTEQYGNYRWRTESGVPEFDPKRPANLQFPLGKDTPEVLRKRGAQWIRAVQEELPGVKIIITFAWSPDANGYEPIKGANGFLNGILDGIQKPAQLIHGYENTFYFGQGPGTKHTRDGFPGGRERFESTRAKIRQWRAFSSNPEKYDAFLRTGMAAWVEDDPWANWPGWPSGGTESFWSNLPLALATSDEYVWVWSEHTRYGVDAKAPVNPFLSSLRNRTFNTGKESTPSMSEDFQTDPLQNGWYFDFDMLAIAGDKKPGHTVPLMSTAKLPYLWDEKIRALNFRSQPATTQRRRYARPVQMPTGQATLRARFDFQLSQFGSNAENPLLLGLFTADQPANKNSLTLRLAAPGQVLFALDQNGITRTAALVPPGGLQTNKTYSLTLETTPGQNQAPTLLRAILSDQSMSSGKNHISQAEISLTTLADLPACDEIGIALWEAATKLTSKQQETEKPTLGKLLKVQFNP